MEDWVYICLVLVTSLTILFHVSSSQYLFSNFAVLWVLFLKIPNPPQTWLQTLTMTIVQRHKFEHLVHKSSLLTETTQNILALYSSQFVTKTTCLLTLTPSKLWYVYTATINFYLFFPMCTLSQPSSLFILKLSLHSIRHYNQEEFLNLKLELYSP